MPAWLDVAMRIGAAVLVIAGIMSLAFWRLPGRNRDKDGHDYDAGNSDGGSGSGEGSHHPGGLGY